MEDSKRSASSIGLIVAIPAPSPVIGVAYTGPSSLKMAVNTAAEGRSTAMAGGVQLHLHLRLCLRN